MKSPLIAVGITLVASIAYGDPLNCSLTEYKASPGLMAAVADDTLTLTWEGNRGQELRLRLTIASGTPTIRDLAVRPKGAQWGDGGEQRDARISCRFRPAPCH